MRAVYVLGCRAQAHRQRWKAHPPKVGERVRAAPLRAADTKRRSSDIRIATAALLAALTLAASTAVAAPQHQHVRHHNPGCWTPGCDRHINRWMAAIAARSRPRFHWTQFVLCVFNHEAGDGKATLSNARLGPIKFTYDDGEYEGAGNWVKSTWETMKRPQDPSNADEASPQAQAEVFMRHANPHDWPRSVPACGG